MNLLYNFLNVIDEVVTQKDLRRSPAGSDFAEKWTWPRHDSDLTKPRRFKRANTVEEYYYVRAIENDMLLGVGALRILWDNDGDFVRESSMDIICTTLDYQYRDNPHRNNDVTGTLKSKLYQHLQVRLASGRFGRGPYIQPETCHPCCHDHRPKPAVCDEPYRRGVDDRGYDYRNHSYPYEPRVSPPMNGPYGGVYNAYQDTDCDHRHPGHRNHR